MALLWGALLLGEQITVSMIFGFALIITGIAVTNWRQKTRPAAV